MSMYDNIRCEYKLPDEEMQEKEFQTKDLDNFLEDYTITSDGTLIHHTKNYEYVPEEERPYYGKEEWQTKPVVRLMGIIKATPSGDEVVNYNGALTFYTFKPEAGSLIYYTASFEDGKLIELIRQHDNAEYGSV